MISQEDVRQITRARYANPEGFGRALPDRPRRAPNPDPRPLLVVAADHPARGTLGVGDEPFAMEDRATLLRRLGEALCNPRVDGVLASADVLEDLAFLGVLDHKLAFGTMNRGGLAGACWELDDRFTAYDTAHLVDRGLDGGKMLLRIDLDDPGTASTLHACARAVTELNDAGIVAMVEPLPYRRSASGRAELDPDPDALVRAVVVAAGLGAATSRTWLKVPANLAPERVLAATTLPTLLLGGDPGGRSEETQRAWGRALALPTARGLVVGRALLYPAAGTVAEAVAAAADLVDRVGHDADAARAVPAAPAQEVG